MNKPHELQGKNDKYMICSQGNREGNPSVVAIPTVDAAVLVKVWPVTQLAGQEDRLGLEKERAKEERG